MATYYPSARLNYYNTIENFLFSLQFPDWQEPDLRMGRERGEEIPWCLAGYFDVGRHRKDGCGAGRGS